MLLYALTTMLVVLVALPLQNTGRLTERTAQGIEFIERGRYNNAVNVLEEIWEQDRSNPAVAENLAIAYLYGDRNTAKARQYMEQAIAGGGRASFLMQHAHEKVAVVATTMSDYCAGRLSIYPGRLAFTAGVADHSFTIPAGEFKEIKTNRWFGKGEGTYHIRTLDKKNYNLRPRTW